MNCPLQIETGVYVKAAGCSTSEISMQFLYLESTSILNESLFKHEWK